MSLLSDATFGMSGGLIIGAFVFLFFPRVDIFTASSIGGIGRVDISDRFGGSFRLEGVCINGSNPRACWRRFSRDFDLGVTLVDTFHKSPDNRTVRRPRRGTPSGFASAVLSFTNERFRVDLRVGLKLATEGGGFRF